MVIRGGLPAGETAGCFSWQCSVRARCEALLGPPRSRLASLWVSGKMNAHRDDQVTRVIVLVGGSSLPPSLIWLESR